MADRNPAHFPDWNVGQAISFSLTVSRAGNNWTVTEGPTLIAQASSGIPNVDGITAHIALMDDLTKLARELQARNDLLENNLKTVTTALDALTARLDQLERR